MDQIAAAFSAVPRRLFLPHGARWRAAFDGPIHIGHGQTNSQPRTVAAMLRLLEVRSVHRVLDVGSGSGWTTALLAHLTGPTGEVLGVELEPDLVEFGSANLAREDRPWASITAADPGVLGRPSARRTTGSSSRPWPASCPACSSSSSSTDGRMAIPVGGRMLLVRRTGDDVEVTEHGEYRFVPLR